MLTSEQINAIHRPQDRQSGEEIADIICLGFLRAEENLKPDLAFLSRLSVTWESLRSRPNDGEIDNHRLIPDSREHLRRFLD